MNNQIIFISTPLGSGKDQILDNIDKLFQLKDKPRIFFKFGGINRLMPTARNPFPRIELTVKDHDQYFQDRFLIYYGWEISECLNELRSAFPQATFFLSYIDRDEGKEKIYKNLLIKSSGMVDGEYLRKKLDEQYDSIKQFVETYIDASANQSSEDLGRKNFTIYGTNG